MKKITIIVVLSVLISACNSTKRVQKLINSGDYNHAIELSVKKLQKGSPSKKKQKLVLFLETAFKKAVETDVRSLNRMEKENNPAVIEAIFETYSALDNRQEIIRPLLPLFIKKENRNAEFKFVDYTDKVNASKATLSDFLYKESQELLSKNNRADARKAYDNLTYLEEINPNFKQTRSLLEEAHFKGTSFVLVNLSNHTNQMIPYRLEADLLNFDTYDLNQFWTVYHSKKENDIDYNYKLELLFRNIDVSPERVQEKQTKLEKEIEDGFEYQLDENGNVATDTLGNSIKIPKYKLVKSDFYEIHQEKASHISGEVILSEQTNGKTRVMDTFPIESEFVFVNDFAEMSGDKDALDDFHLKLLRQREIPFPSDEQMIFDTGEDLKNKLKSIIDDFNI